VPNSSDHYLAVFNTNEAPANQASSTIQINLSELGAAGECKVRDLWKKQELGKFSAKLPVEIAAHGAALFRITAL
jgi:hypothetical protein